MQTSNIRAKRKSGTHEEGFGTPESMGLGPQGGIIESKAYPSMSLGSWNGGTGYSFIFLCLLFYNSQYRNLVGLEMIISERLLRNTNEIIGWFWRATG